MKRVIKNKVFIIIILIFEILFLAYSPSMAATTIYDYWPTADSTENSKIITDNKKLYDVSSLEQKDTFTTNQYVSIGIISKTEADYLGSNNDTGITYTLVNSGLYYSEDTRKILSRSSNTNGRWNEYFYFIFI